MLDHKISILMVDDREENLIALEAVLSPLGHELIGLRSGQDVLRYILRENIEQVAVILLDVQMKDMDGFETAKLIKSRDKAKEIPIIFITAQNKSMDHVLYGYHLGSVDYMFKPYHPEVLQRKVEAFVTLHRYHRKVKEQGKLLEKRAAELEGMNKKLARAEALSRMVSETSIDSIMRCDGQGVVVWVNPAVEKMFGYTHLQAIGKHINEFIPGAATQPYADGLMEAVAIRRNGERFPVEYQMGEATLDDTTFFVCSVRDITEKKQIEQERNEQYDILEKMVAERTEELIAANNKLRKSQERFEKLFVSTPCLVAIRRLSDRVYIDVNENWLQFTGYDKDDLIGQTCDLFVESESEHESDQRRYVPGCNCMNVQVQYTTKSGETRDGLLSVEITEIDGETCELCVITDITEKVQWEKEMVRLGKLSLIGEMAAGIAHEIRNPMTVVKGFLQIYKQNRSMTMENADIMLEELSRANDIITEYLSLSKNKPAYLAPCQLRDIIESLLPLLKADAMLAGKTIETRYDDCPVIDLDEKEIRQLVLNLAINGLEAMDAGMTLRISTHLEERAVVLKVADQGCGIDPKHIEKLGTPFFTTKPSGTGLGLAVCYSIANRHRAVISIDSSGRGTTVYVRFPLREWGEAPPSTP